MVSGSLKRQLREKKGTATGAEVYTCFVILPFREERKLFDKVYSSIIKPSVDALQRWKVKVRLVRVDYTQPGRFSHRIAQIVANADVVLVDVTTLDPNVFYALGARHTLRDRVTVLLRRTGTRIRFNLLGMTVIDYDLDSRSATDAREAITQSIANGLANGVNDSPFYLTLPDLVAYREPRPFKRNLPIYEQSVARVNRVRTARNALRVFLCHASEDKQAVRVLYARLVRAGFSPWLDEKSLIPGQNWDLEIRRAVKESDVVLVCLSKRSEKRGYVQKEIVRALDAADEQPEGKTFVIPVRLEACSVPDRLSRWQYVDLFSSGGFAKLEVALEGVA
jgi:hypothetical protein